MSPKFRKTQYSDNPLSPYIYLPANTTSTSTIKPPLKRRSLWISVTKNASTKCSENWNKISLTPLVLRLKFACLVAVFAKRWRFNSYVNRMSGYWNYYNRHDMGCLIELLHFYHSLLWGTWDFEYFKSMLILCKDPAMLNIFRIQIVTVRFFGQ